ncbi:MAG: DnaJ domain-containing protein [Actinomycetota bacterium]
MDIADYYRQLGLRAGASLSQVKASYRRLARQYHPDVNPGDERAKNTFIAITEAYKFLLGVAPAEVEAVKPPTPKPTTEAVSQPQPKTVKVTRKEPRIQYQVPLSTQEQLLKRDSYLQLQQLLKYHRFPRAIALVEGLAQRMPQDAEVRQWQAIAYQRWARQLINERQVEKARSYLKKALRTDPHNRALWAEVEKEFRRLEEIY